MAVSKGFALALDLDTPSHSTGPLAFDLGPQLAQGTLGSSIGASLTFDLGNLACSMGHVVFDMGPHLAPAATVSEGAPFTLGLEPLALGAHLLLIWSPYLLHGAPWLLIWGSSLLQRLHEPLSPQWSRCPFI